jgi:hypothetical protein
VCNASSCPGCFILEIPCCKSDKTCGCQGFLGGCN